MDVKSNPETYRKVLESMNDNQWSTRAVLGHIQDCLGPAPACDHEGPKCEGLAAEVDHVLQFIDDVLNGRDIITDESLREGMKS